MVSYHLSTMIRTVSSCAQDVYGKIILIAKEEFQQVELLLSLSSILSLLKSLDGKVVDIDYNFFLHSSINLY